MCIDFSDHNEASLKDDFPLPYFNILDDNEARHELLDGFSEYNKIKVVPEDMHKTSVFPSGEHFANVSCLSSQTRASTLHISYCYDYKFFTIWCM